jgi:hypothetical protein
MIKQREIHPIFQAFPLRRKFVPYYIGFKREGGFSLVRGEDEDDPLPDCTPDWELEYTAVLSIYSEEREAAVLRIEPHLFPVIEAARRTMF